MPRLLLTNDDGIEAAGLRELRRALAGAGFDLVTIAPALNQSGVARLATYADPVHLSELPDDGLGPTFACEGTPVDCVRVGLLSDVAAGTDLVVSGVNFGCNLGDDILNSGTVGAASEAALLGVPALALSEQSKPGSFHILDPHDKTTRTAVGVADLATVVVAEMVRLKHPDRVVLNVNFPSGEPCDIQVTHPSRRLYALGSIDADAQLDRPFGYRTYGTREGPSPEFEMAEGTDAHAVARRFVSLSPISYEWRQGHDAGADAWIEELAGVLRRHVRDRTWAAPVPGTGAAAGP